AVPATGNVAPSSHMTSNIASTENFYAMTFDAQGDLWTANCEDGTLTEYGPGQFTTATAIPLVTLTNDGTGSLACPAGVVFDGAGNLWVGNYSSGSVVEFTASQLAASGSPTPAVTIANDGTTSIAGPEELAIDAQGDLWVANSTTATVVEFTAAQLASSGDPTPAVTVTSVTVTSVPSLHYPTGVSFDAAGNLWVSNDEGSSLVEYSPSQLTAGGAQTPTKTITGLDSPWQSGFDSAGNLWVSTGGNGLVGYSPAQLASGGTAAAPAYAIAGTTTGLTGPAGLALKTAPTVTSVTPNGGPAGGGGTVTVKGTGFTSATTVDFGPTAATTVKVTSPFALTAVAP